MMRAHLIILACLALPGIASAEACRTVHGRMSLANGAPTVRIWVIGSNRVLGVVQQNERFDDLPANVRRIWAADGDDAMWRSDLFGHFRVCAVTPSRPGRMQLVSLKAASDLRRSARN